MDCFDSRAQHYRLLIVEDDDDDFAIAQRVIRRVAPDVEIKRALDGAEALHMLETCGADGLPHVLLSDVKMPRLNGIELVRWVRQNAPEPHLPLVVLTSSSEPRDMADAYSAGASAFLVKAVDYDQYSKELEAFCRFYFGVVRYPDLSRA